MSQPMKGVKILEIAQYTFVPAAGAVLSDWGAEVIKVEPAETGDAQRGIVHVLGLNALEPGSSFFPVMEGPNRNKRSIGLDLGKPESRPVLEALIRDADVFLTNYLPRLRTKFGIELEDVRRINPNIIYVRGTGFGARGPEADSGGYDSTAFWARAGSAAHVTPPDADALCAMPAGAYGDNLGGMTIAGGISAALYKRAMTGETSVVDVSLFGVGAWAMQFAINLSMVVGGPLNDLGNPRVVGSKNPLSASYRTSDGRWIMLTMLQPGRFWPGFVELIGRPELAGDERFDSAEKLMENAPIAAQELAATIRQQPYEHWVKLFETMEGPWAPVQEAWDIANDPQLRANGFIAKFVDADGRERELVTSPVQFDETPQTLTRAPQFAEHTDEILAEIGLSEEETINLKIAGAVT
jgi:crotonobetainyl-CoA:carnitine CoA-transferase CaiB-like acyl-CoA transferase